MFKFLFNCILYGFLFYLLWRYSPETINTLVSWMDNVYDVIVDVFNWGVDFVRALIAKR